MAKQTIPTHHSLVICPSHCPNAHWPVKKSDQFWVPHSLEKARLELSTQLMLLLFRLAMEEENEEETYYPNTTPTVHSVLTQPAPPVCQQTEAPMAEERQEAGVGPVATNGGEMEGRGGGSGSTGAMTPPSHPPATPTNHRQSNRADSMESTEVLRSQQVTSSTAIGAKLRTTEEHAAIQHQHRWGRNPQFWHWVYTILNSFSRLSLRNLTPLRLVHRHPPCQACPSS